MTISMLSFMYDGPTDTSIYEALIYYLVSRNSEAFALKKVLRIMKICLSALLCICDMCSSLNPFATG